MLHAHFNILLKIFFKFQESYHGRIPNLILTRNKWLIQLCAQCPHSLWTTQLHSNQLLVQTIGHKNWSCSLSLKGNLLIHYVSKRKQFESYRQFFLGKMTLHSIHGFVNLKGRLMIKRNPFVKVSQLRAWNHCPSFLHFTLKSLWTVSSCIFWRWHKTEKVFCNLATFNYFQ